MILPSGQARPLVPLGPLRQMAPIHRFETARSYQAVSLVDDLVARMGRLAVHRGFVREAIASPMLKRLMPRERLAKRAAFETSLRRRLESEKPRPDQIAYLVRLAEDELDLAHERTT